MSSLSRRNFLVGTGAMAAVGAIGLAGCQQGGGDKPAPEPAPPPVDPSVTLTCLPPRGEVEPPEVFAPNPRPTDMSKVKWATYWNSKLNGFMFLDEISRLVGEKYGNPALSWNGGFEINDQQVQEMVDAGVEAVLYGFGD